MLFDGVLLGSGWNVGSVLDVALGEPIRKYTVKVKGNGMAGSSQKVRHGTRR